MNQRGFTPLLLFISVLAISALIVSGSLLIKNKLLNKTTINIANNINSSPLEIKNKTYSIDNKIDNKIIYFQFEESSTAVYTFDYKGERTELLKIPAITYPVLSPNRQRIIYTKGDSQKAYILDLQTSEEKEFTIKDARGGIDSFFWHPEGRKVLIHFFSNETKYPSNKPNSMIGMPALVFVHTVVVLDLEKGESKKIDLSKFGLPENVSERSFPRFPTRVTKEGIYFRGEEDKLIMYKWNLQKFDIVDVALPCKIADISPASDMLLLYDGYECEPTGILLYNLKTKERKPLPTTLNRDQIFKSNLSRRMH